MKIDKHNYEAFFLDFAEGKLDDSSTLEMLAFLRNHPELKEELESFCDVKLKPSHEIFIEKDFLKKMDFSNTSVNDKNFGDYCIAFYEKLLSPSESEKLFSYLKLFPEKTTDFQQFGKTMLIADENVFFEGKSFLKKKPKTSVRTIVLRWSAVAAGIVLAVSIFYKSPVDDKIKTPINRMAATNNRIEPKPPVFKVVPETKLTVKQSKAIIQTVEKDTDRETQVEIERLNYLSPIEIASLEDHGELQRPEFSVSYEIAAVNNDQEEMELMDYAEKMIRSKVLKQSVQNKPRRKLTLWDIAAVTLKGYNHISEKDIILHRETDVDGKLTAVAVETENRKYVYETKN